MALISQLSDHILWAVDKIDKSSDDLLNLLEKQSMYLPFINQITTETRKQEWLATRILLKELLQEEKEIEYTNSGKPYLTDHSYHISISHTKGYVAVALCKDFPVGIDIEYLSSRIKRIQNRFLNPEEISNVYKNDEEISLLLHWSAKESVFKALEEENVDFKNHLHVTPFIPLLNALSSFHTFETKTTSKISFVVNYVANYEYVLTFTAKIP